MLLVFECDSYREASILNMQQTEKYFTLYILIFGATGSRCAVTYARDFNAFTCPEPCSRENPQSDQLHTERKA